MIHIFINYNTKTKLGVDLKYYIPTHLNYITHNYEGVFTWRNNKYFQNHRYFLEFKSDNDKKRK